MVKNLTKAPNRRKIKYSNTLLWGGNPISTAVYSYSYLHVIPSMHSLPIPHTLLGGDVFCFWGFVALFGCWVEGFCLHLGGYDHFVLIFLNKVPCPVCRGFCSSCSGSASHEKQALSNELERELRTQALSQHQETISTSEVRKLFARYSTSLCATFYWRRESAVMPHKCKQAYQQPLDLIILHCCCFFQICTTTLPRQQWTTLDLCFVFCSIQRQHTYYWVSPELCTHWLAK